MWFIYILSRENNYNGEVYKRLKVSQTYIVSASQKNVEAFKLVMGEMSQDKVDNINFRPTVTLIKQGDVEIKVDDNVVTDPEITLMDQQRINVQDEHMQYRLQWEELNIYHNKKQPDDRPIDPSLTKLLDEQRTMLVKSALTYGIHVSSKYDQRTTTHCYISHSQQHPYQPSKNELLALCHKKIFITKPWIDGLDDANDKGFNLTDYNSSAKTIEIDNWGPLKRTALFGPNNRRKELFSSTDFWFFNEKQHEEYKDLIRLCGGKSGVHTLEDGLTSDLSEEYPLFVVPEPANPDFVPVMERYHENEEARCILGWEIYFGIVYMSTNYCCNPHANLHDVIDPNSPYSESFSNSVKVKEEPVDIHDQPTVAAAQTYAYSGIGEVDIHDRPTVAADIHELATVPAHTIDYTEPRIKEETIESTMDDYDDYKDPAWTNEDTQSHQSVQQGRSILQEGRSVLQGGSSIIQQSGNSLQHGSSSSSAQDFHTAQQEQHTEQQDHEMQENHDIDEPMEDIVVPNSLGDLEEIEDDMEDVSDFLGNIISSQPKDAAKKRAERLEKERLEKEKKEKEQQERERVEREQTQRLERLQQQEHERSERQPSEQERKQKELERLERERKEMARRRLDQEREDEEQAAPSQDPDATITDDPIEEEPIEEEPVEEEPAILTVNTTQEDTYVDDTGMDIDDSQPIHYAEEDGGKFIKVVYAPLVVKPRPSSLPAPTRRQSGVNFKKFVKTRQLQTVNRTDHVTLLTSSQIPRTQQATREVRIENAAEFDPDIMITTARRRVR